MTATDGSAPLLPSSVRSRDTKRPRALPAGGSRRVYLAAKRLVDLVLAALGLVALLPVTAVVALLVRLTSSGPALFRQTRVGRNGRLFTMLKFRTMNSGCSDELHRAYVRELLTQDQPSPAGRQRLYKLDNDSRVTPLGRVLRRTSIDELPQLLNVLRGDMSLVGPRPVLPWEADLLRDGYAGRFGVPPGITGLWQTSGRSTLTMRQALDLDLDYVDRRGMVLDLRILLKTALVVLRPGDAE
jgi:lipopolysaccharide/colanic/teichoic acid biosynthesis glycosyltransferase